MEYVRFRAKARRAFDTPLQGATTNFKRTSVAVIQTIPSRAGRSPTLSKECVRTPFCRIASRLHRSAWSAGLLPLRVRVLRLTVLLLRRAPPKPAARGRVADDLTRGIVPMLRLSRWKIPRGLAGSVVPMAWRVSRPGPTRSGPRLAPMRPSVESLQYSMLRQLRCAAGVVS
jgi:hypothetical protein